MDECKEAIKQYVDSAGGRALYSDVLGSVPPEYRKYIPSALRVMKAAGEMYKQNRIEDGKPVFYVFRPGK
jgi:hypothetical protein